MSYEFLEMVISCWILDIELGMSGSQLATWWLLYPCAS